MNQNVDLRALAVRRDDAPRAAQTRRSYHLGTRFVLPGLLLAGFIAIAGWAARDRLLPARPVTIMPVFTTHMDIQNEGTPLFQAAGWIEPRPTSILVTALTEGVIEKLLVVEGQKIMAGEQVAQLIQEDARLALQTAEADRELRQAESAHARAVRVAARTNLEKPVHLKAAFAEAEAMTAQKETELAALPFQWTAARARLKLAEQSYEGKKQAYEMAALPLFTFNQAKSELDSAASAVAELESRQGKLKTEIEAQKRRQGALKERFELKTEEIRLYAEADAALLVAIARLKQADIGVTTAQLRLERTMIKAPSNGQVLALVARPGQRLMGQAAMGHPEASTIITMFDPGMIQVRADVRLDDVPKVQPGQRVAIDTPVMPDHPLEGEVLQITSQADIQKNTLQVKVAIKSPPSTLRPDMLVQVTFLALPSHEVADPETPALRLLIPRQLVESTDGNTHVWIADLAGKVARKQAIKLGRSSGDFIEVVQGLNPADRLIADGRQGLGDGQRIAVTHAETGIESMRHDGKQHHSGKH